MSKDDEQPGTPAPPTPPSAGEETPAWARELTESNNRLAEKMGGVLDWITTPEDSEPTPAPAPPNNLPQPDALDALGRRLQAVEALVLTPQPPTPAAPPQEPSPAPPSPSPDAPGEPANTDPPASQPKTSAALGWLTRPL